MRQGAFGRDAAKAPLEDLMAIAARLEEEHVHVRAYRTEEVAVERGVAKVRDEGVRELIRTVVQAVVAKGEEDRDRQDGEGRGVSDALVACGGGLPGGWASGLTGGCGGSLAGVVIGGWACCLSGGWVGDLTGGWASLAVELASTRRLASSWANTFQIV